MVNNVATVPYKLGTEVIATDDGYKTLSSTWIHIEAKLKDASEAVIEALECGMIGEDTEIHNYHAGIGNTTNTFTLQYTDGSTQTYENCAHFDVDYDSSTGKVNFPLFFSMLLDGELTEEAKIATYHKLQGVKLKDIALCIQGYELFKLEKVELILDEEIEIAFELTMEQQVGDIHV